MIVKARKQGNSIVLTVPKTIKVDQNTKFSVKMTADGDLIYRRVNRKKYDLWSDPAYKNFDYQKELKQEYQDLGYNPREVKPIGREIPHA